MQGTDYINPNDDIIDSRDIIARIDYLAYLDDEPEEDRDEEDYAELMALRDLENEAECSPDWIHGETLINSDYFVDYARQLAEDIYDLKDHWPYTCIDWDSAAEELEQDYMLVTYADNDFWIRA
jgi:hypothetical protein